VSGCFGSPSRVPAGRCDGLTAALEVCEAEC
jgi:hypothetical protein